MENDVGDSNFTMRTPLLVTILGDVNGGRTVDVLDLVLVTSHLAHALSYSIQETKERWDCNNTDLTGNGQHNVFDLILAAQSGATLAMRKSLP